jgi:predicted Abi (CAAX) family protease
MRLFIRTVLFHMMCIVIFSIVYFYLKGEFHYKPSDDPTFFDSLFLSVTIQSGVGITDIYPRSSVGKAVMILQQFTLILTQVFTIYVFSL